ncbi:K(+)-transporting ATPase subunit C [Flavobacterium sp.]|uniref:K(+)-transporting ATPase subunit C n=1 Tax=Flavobacterium sp. TaxID=239 RepID=UPI0039E4A401
MKHTFQIVRLTFVLLLLCAIFYPMVIYGIAQFVPNQGKGETVSYNGKVVGYKLIGQKFDQTGFFWGRPSAVDYNAAGSAGSNKGPSNPEYLAEVQQRIDTFLIAHPYLKKSDIPADIVTASGSGLDPDISYQAALVQVKRVANQNHLAEATVRELVEKHLNRPTLAGVPTVNVLALNIELKQLQ